jgi:hypothetical protein
MADPWFLSSIPVIDRADSLTNIPELRFLANSGKARHAPSGPTTAKYCGSSGRHLLRTLNVVESYLEVPGKMWACSGSRADESRIARVNPCADGWRRPRCLLLTRPPHGYTPVTHFKLYDADADHFLNYI